MSFPKKQKKNVPLTKEKILFPRREELKDMIAKNGTFLPKSILHEDLDSGFLDFVKEDLKLVIEQGIKVPVLDIILTIQNWSQFTETWQFQDLDKNAVPPFITILRHPEVKYGTNPALVYNIPNRRQYYYHIQPTWDGQRGGADIYTIPQPVPIDINFSVKIVCNRMRELNDFNQIVIEKFASRQAYRVIKGHYIPIVMNNTSDESVIDIDKRKYYVQNYDFTMLGFLIDEKEFKISPAISRTLLLTEVNTKKIPKKNPHIVQNTDIFELDINYVSGTTSITKTFDYTVNLIQENLINISSYDTFINGNFYGSLLGTIQINDKDVVTFNIIPKQSGSTSTIKFSAQLL